ncbi:LysR family transcriptional regulator [Celeribacter indicus]|uniref:Protein GbuR n=1 Tax=Celeribacter indicus TaxID=1208324 RepID=A0A0B5DNM3_9RHOB|nr:LysR family transcriptional regulator [Celeribacter indicus]AJE44794.1 protein GbuR [Celeribacter indicus]SDX47124.1 transcriptional regulator [Celeribacter indicus]
MQLSGTDIRLLRVFDAVVRHRGLAAAQAELNVSQSTISTQIAALEDRLGMTLCRRGRAGFQLTQNGEAVHAAVMRLLAATEEFVSETAALRGALSGTLRIGIVDHVVTDPNFRLSEAIAALENRATSVRFELAQGSPQELQARVREGSLHLGIGSFPHKVTGLDYAPLYTETNYLYCAQGHPLWSVPDGDLTPEFVATMRAVGRSYWRDDHWNNRDFPNSTAMAQGLEQQLVMILSGAFVGYMPDHSAARWVAAGRLKPLLPDRFIYRCTFEAISRPDAEASPLAQAMREELAKLYKGFAQKTGRL